MAFINIIDIVYPAGSIYLSTTTVSPATLFGGTWTQIKNTLIGTSGDTYGAVGNSGGDAKIRNYNLPEHIHNCVAAIGYDKIDSGDYEWASYYFSNANSGSEWSVATRGSNPDSGDWLYAANLTGFTGTRNQDYIPYHYNCNIWRRTA